MSGKSKAPPDFICQVQYRNPLPPVPCPPKLLTLPSDPKRHVTYRTTSLETQSPYPLETEPKYDLESMETIILEHLSLMEDNPNARVEADIPEEDYVFLLSPQTSQTSRPKHQPNVNWLRTVPLATEQRQPSAPRPKKPERTAHMQSALHEDYMTERGRLVGVENTFVQLDESLRHPKTKVKAKRILPVLPDLSCWENMYTLGQFDTDPSDKERQQKRRKPIPDQGSSGAKRGRPFEEDATDRGIMRPVTNPHDEDDKYLIWFLPDKVSTGRLVQQKKTDASIGQQPLTFNAVRDYTYEKSSNEKEALFTLRNDSNGGPGYYYSLIEGGKMIVRHKRVSKNHIKEDYEKPNVLSVTYSESAYEDDGMDEEG